MRFSLAPLGAAVFHFTNADLYTQGEPSPCFRSRSSGDLSSATAPTFPLRVSAGVSTSRAAAASRQDARMHSRSQRQGPRRYPRSLSRRQIKCETSACVGWVWADRLSQKPQCRKCGVAYPAGPAPRSEPLPKGRDGGAPTRKRRRERSISRCLTPNCEGWIFSARIRRNTQSCHACSAPFVLGASEAAVESPSGSHVPHPPRPRRGIIRGFSMALGARLRQLRLLHQRFPQQTRRPRLPGGNAVSVVFGSFWSCSGNDVLFR